MCFLVYERGCLQLGLTCGLHVYLCSCFQMLQLILQMVKHQKKKSQKQERTVPTCHICMTNPINCKVVTCEHDFCFRCLSKWARRKGTCPNCRQNVRKIQYKRKVIEPEYLKIFDRQKEESSSLQLSLSSSGVVGREAVVRAPVQRMPIFPVQHPWYQWYFYNYMPVYQPTYYILL